MPNGESDRRIPRIDLIRICSFRCLEQGKAENQAQRLFRNSHSISYSYPFRGGIVASLASEYWSARCVRRLPMMDLLITSYRQATGTFQPGLRANHPRQRPSALI